MSNIEKEKYKNDKSLTSDNDIFMRDGSSNRKQ